MGDLHPEEIIVPEQLNSGTSACPVVRCGELERFETADAQDTLDHDAGQGVFLVRLFLFPVASHDATVSYNTA